MAAVVANRTFFEAMLVTLKQAASGAAGPLHGATIDLFQTPQSLTDTTTYATLTGAIATYDGYSSGQPYTVTWSAVSEGEDGVIEMLGTAVEFRPSGSTTPNSIYGFYLNNAGATDWLLAGEVDNAPVNMASDLDHLTITVRYRPDDQSLAVSIS
jgi:hypothetical protein